MERRKRKFPSVEIHIPNECKSFIRGSNIPPQKSLKNIDLI